MCRSEQWRSANLPRNVKRSGLLLFMAGLLMFSIFTALAISTNPARGSAEISDDSGYRSYPACESKALVLAEYMLWHGLPTHQDPPPYLSTDPEVMKRHIRAAQAQCINGFVVNWYGPPDGMPNDIDREFIDEALQSLIEIAEEYGFKVAISYDENTLTGAASIQEQAISDLRYAREYFISPAYLHLNEALEIEMDPDENRKPMLFIFPYSEIDQEIAWESVRSELATPVILLEKDPDPADPGHDGLFDGFFAWVQPTAGEWRPDGTEWGEGYLRWFYNTMASPTYSDTIAVGGVWPGFDDASAPWDSGRYMLRRCGQTWNDTWGLALDYNPPVVLIATWNDFEEGTAIENDSGRCLSPQLLRCANFGQTIELVHKLANTDRTTTFSMSVSSESDWITNVSPGSAELQGNQSTLVTVTVTAPETESDLTDQFTSFVVAATPALSGSIGNTVTDTVYVGMPSCSNHSHLPIIWRYPWCERFNPLLQAWFPAGAKWIDPPGSTALLMEDNPNEVFGKVEASIDRQDLDAYPILRINVTHVDPDSSYTVQINDEKDILTGITTPGEHKINLANEMGWEGIQSFSINLWISGEGKSIEFETICFEAE